ncbi:MAG: glycosyltransferase family 4 protein, partial [Pseudomonadota bacterium]
RIAVSKACADEIASISERSFEVIPNGVDVKWWHREQNEKNGNEVNIVYMGRADIRNGLDKVIEAFGIVRKTDPNVRLTIIGDGPLLSIFKNQAKHLLPYITFHGALSETRPDVVATADIFIFTPHIASFGITIIEGMAARKAIIASDIPAFKELLKNNESGLLVDPDSPEAIASAMSRLAADKDLRFKLAERAFRDVGKYDWENVSERIINCYEKAVSCKL